MNRPGTIFSTLTLAGIAWMAGCQTEDPGSIAVINSQEQGAPMQGTGENPYPAAPYLSELESTVLFGDIWQRPGLSPRDRSLVTVAVTQALYRTEELREALDQALDNGVTRDEIAELMTHVTMYAGWPTGSNASRVAIRVYEARGLSFPPPVEPVNLQIDLRGGNPGAPH